MQPSREVGRFDNGFGGFPWEFSSFSLLHAMCHTGGAADAGAFAVNGVAAMDVVPREWAQMEFAACELGDKRRTKRLIKAAEQVLARPDASTPEQIESWSDCKALYRLMDCDDVSSRILARFTF